MRGYSLLEVVVATSLVAVAVVTLAPLVALAAYANFHAGQMTIATVLAQGKVEELLPEADTWVMPSPADALRRDVVGFSDVVDRTGHVLGGGPTAYGGSAFMRRWSIERQPSSAGKMWILQVLVRDKRGRDVARIVAATAGRAF
jgi:hypothetical protein